MLRGEQPKFVVYLKWQLQYGKNLQFLQSLEAKGKTVPILANAPVLFEDLQSTWEAFQILNNCRQHTGFGANPIMLSEMMVCAQYKNLPLDEAIYMLQELDKEYLDYVNPKSSNRRSGS